MLIEKKKLLLRDKQIRQKKVGKNFTNLFPNKKELLKITMPDLDFFLHKSEEK